jgi:hypothetical protein
MQNTSFASSSTRWHPTTQQQQQQQQQSKTINIKGAARVRIGWWWFYGIDENELSNKGGAAWQVKDSRFLLAET